MKREITDLVGEKLIKVEVDPRKETVKFQCESGKTYMMHHFQDCCENVWLADIVGDLEDLEDCEVTQCSVDSAGYDKSYGHMTWTFYTVKTHRSVVTFRFCGESNGYYSESVSFVEVTDTGEKYDRIKFGEENWFRA